MNAFYVLVFVIILLVLLPMCLYMSFKVNKLNFVSSIKNKKTSFLISSIPIIFFIFLLIWNYVNAYIIILHFFFVIWFGYIIYYFVRKITKKEYKYGNEIILSLSFVILTIYLGYAYYNAHNVVETHYTVYTDKNIGVENFRIVQITDSHVGATMNGDKFYSYMEVINKTNPDIVVVTGDFVDDDTSFKDMVRSCEGLGALKTKYGVYYVYGNHDKGYFDYRGYTDKELRENLLKNNVVILEDEGLDILDNIYLLGRQDRIEKTRKKAQELTENIDKSKYIITLDHEPNDYKNEKEAEMDLVISGHTHGGQLIPIKYFDMLVGANDFIYGMKKDEGTTFIVSSGIGDWAVKFKTGCKAEYVVIDIKNKG